MSGDFEDSLFAWESRGRGWYIYTDPVQLEPIYTPFFPPQIEVSQDDGRIPIFNGLRKLFKGEEKKEKTQEIDQAYISESDGNNTAYRIGFPQGFKADRGREVELLTVLSAQHFHISWELTVTPSESFITLVVPFIHGETLRAVLLAYFPELQIIPIDPSFPTPIDEESTAIVDFGLRNESYLPIRDFKSKGIDPYLSLLAPQDRLRNGEWYSIQCMFQGVQNPWGKAWLSAITLQDGSSIFSDAPEHLPLAKSKCQDPIFAVTLRTIVHGEDQERSAEIFDLLQRSFVSIGREGSNSLVPLSNKGIPGSTHANLAILRESMRTGMLLSLGELGSLIHLPGESIQKFSGTGRKERRIHQRLTTGQYLLGHNIFGSERNPVYLTDEARLRHMHIIGATGTGKSTLLTHLVLEDIRAGNGICVVDPHGDLVDDILIRIPENRHGDVIVIDPAYEEGVIGLNLLSATTEQEKLFLSEDLVSIISGQATSWGDQMSHVLSYAISAFVDSPDGGTLLDLRRFLTDKEFRSERLARIQDPLVRQFWKDEFGSTHMKSVVPVVTRLDAFLRSKILRAMMSTKEGIDLGKIIGERKLLFLKLSLGRIGEFNTSLLGSLIITKLYQAALTRQNTAKDERTPFYLYIDEFHHFRTKGLVSLLTGARKYGLGAILAHQSLEQLRSDKELIGALLGVNIRASFALGSQDSSAVAGSYEYFLPEDFKSLARGEAIAKVGPDEFSLESIPPGLKPDDGIEVDDFIRQSIQRYGQKFTRKESSPEVPEAKPAQSVKHSEDLPELVRGVKEVKSDLESEKEKFVAQTERHERRKEHGLLVEQIRKLAQSHNWHVVTEAPLPDGGRIDLLLTNNGVSIGIEVSVTNTVDYEVENLRKCLSFGCTYVLSVTEDSAKREGIQAELTSEEGEKVFCISSKELLSWLVAKSQENQSGDRRVRGYKVKVVHVPTEKDPIKSVREILMSKGNSPPQ